MSPVARIQSSGMMNDIVGEPYQGIKENFQVIYKKIEHYLFAQHHIITSNLKTGKEMKVKNQNPLLSWKQNSKKKYFHFGFCTNTVSVINLFEHWCCAKDFFPGLAILIGFLEESKVRNSAHFLYYTRTDAVRMATNLRCSPQKGDAQKRLT